MLGKVASIGTEILNAVQFVGLCSLPIHLCGFPNVEVGAEGARPDVVEAAVGRPMFDDDKAAAIAPQTHLNEDHSQWMPIYQEG